MQWWATKPFIQWQWLDWKNHWKNHWYQLLKSEKPLKNHRHQWLTCKKNHWKTINFNGTLTKTINHSIVVKILPSLRSILKCAWWPYIEKTKHNVWLKKNDHNFCWKEKKKRPIPIQSSEVRFVPPVTVGRRVKFLPSVLHFHSFHSKISDLGFLSVSFDFFCMKSHCKP